MISLRAAAPRARAGGGPDRGGHGRCHLATRAGAPGWRPGRAAPGLDDEEAQ
ncbi:hypothetical protein V1634_08395 [Plantactinospora veratri]|uniref:Uncharacterized protein n=1 Tax=Plantactinospora veratri TaxID=1436122 RepID=A0ABU7SB51_9ACTN